MFISDGVQELHLRPSLAPAPGTRSACSRSAFFVVAFVLLLQVPTVYAHSTITAAVWSPDGKQIILGSQSGLELRSWPDLEIQRTLATELIHIHDLRFSPDGHKLLVAGGTPAETGDIEIWNWPALTRVAHWNCHRDVVYQAIWLADNNRLVTASADGVCHVFDSELGKAVRSYQQHSGPVTCILLGDNDTVYSAGVDQTIRCWNVTTGESIRSLDNHLGPLVDLAIVHKEKDESPRLFSLSEDRTIRLWQPDIGRMMRFYKSPSVPRIAAISTNSPLLFVGCNDGLIRVLNRETMSAQTSIETPYGRITTLLLDATQRLLFVSGSEGLGCIAIPDE